MTENGFIDNISDAAKLKKSAFIEYWAHGHVNGTVKSFSLNRKENEVPGNTHDIVNLW